MSKRLIFILLILGVTTSAFAQEKNMWKTLSNVTVEKSFDEILSIDVEHYNFASQVKALNGKEISLEGWMIPLDELRGENYFVLSSLPFANCFFCGGAGPETVAEVFSKKEVKFTEKKVKVTGILTLNSDDPLRLMYILNDVEVQEVKD
ncbi:hypothetical protein EV198_1376 [Roseivirga ehrenbergii]|uniref:DUF3299 domain-containing protein n=1 Tax=Roseivirga ehrenbergii (strain DSM 102268 / JCM 13514 / KCTC 12282 / NCIMB 14502 / KMM 6017) TaxID=279360 RepID=A0A150XIW4_ROSEK|nr:hypothetical protein [Roseivirga ehrenbergii]KYG78677.1 hypothetical protein MB14_18285 [Roseivirga ehrenbergii]TCL10346.1 hypothetical protein EV198_1376 [Roseivirga ehrenbergii]